MNFIETYDNALTPEACKKIIDFFDFAPLQIKKEGETYLNQTTLGVNKNVKDSLDITMNFDRLTEPDQIIISALRTGIEKYKEKHTETENVAAWSLTDI